MPPRLTQLRLALLQTLARLTREHGRPPSATELAHAAGITPATLSSHLKVLDALGYVTRPTPRAGLQLTPKARALTPLGYPIYGQIAAGPPILADQQPDQVIENLADFLGMHHGDFILRVNGESMTGIGVMHGDYVAVRPASTVLDGEVAVVLLPGENAATLKRVFQLGDEVILTSENPDMPRLVFPAEQVQVQGRMIARFGGAAPRTTGATVRRRR